MSPWTLPRAIGDSLTRRKAAFHKTPLDRYQVRVARTVQEYEDAFRLVHAAYVFQGIEHLRASELRVTKQHFLPEATVLVAYEGTQLVGTMTVILDSPAGLPLDKDYSQALAALRQQGARLVEYSSYAIVERCWSSGVSNLLYMACTTIAARQSHATHVVIGVHPHAEAFYRAALSFEVLGESQGHATLKAPVVGLVQDLPAFAPFLGRHYKKPMASGRLPVEHFFGAPHPCFSLTTAASNGQSSGRGPMPREVLQTLLRERSDIVQSFDPETVRHLESRRSRTTLTLPETLSETLRGEVAEQPVVRASLASLRSSPSGSPASRGPSEGSGPAASERQVARVKLITPVKGDKEQFAC